MDLTKGMECPRCGEKKPFQGGSFGGGLNSTNFNCDCGFTAWILMTDDKYEYSVMKEHKDCEKANPYTKFEKDNLIVKKHYFNEALKHSEGMVYSMLNKHISFIDDILKNE